MRLLLLIAPLLALASCAPVRRDVQVFTPNYREARFELTGKVSFEKKDNHEHARIDCLKRPKLSQTLWLPEGSPDHTQIDPQTVYLCEILESRFFEKGDGTYPDRDYTTRTLLRLKTGGRIIYDASVCQVHHRPMTRRMEDRESTEEKPDSFFRALGRSFPHDGISYVGCGSGISHPLWFCPDCGAASADWKKRHGIPRR